MTQYIHFFKLQSTGIDTGSTFILILSIFGGKLSQLGPELGVNYYDFSSTSVHYIKIHQKFPPTHPFGNTKILKEPVSHILPFALHWQEANLRRYMEGCYVKLDWEVVGRNDLDWQVLYGGGSVPAAAV